MSTNEPILLQKLSAKMSYLSERQGLLAKNIANIDTPGYRTQDLKKLDFDNMVSGSSTLEMMTTSPKHIASPQNGTSFAKNTAGGKPGLKPDGNNVVLEDQMGKISDVGIQHQMTSTLLKKFHQLYRTAVDNKA